MSVRDELKSKLQTAELEMQFDDHARPMFAALKLVNAMLEVGDYCGHVQITFSPAIEASSAVILLPADVKDRLEFLELFELFEKANEEHRKEETATDFLATYIKFPKGAEPGTGGC